MIKNGKKIQRTGTKQEYKCKACARRFLTPRESVVIEKTENIEPGRIFSAEFDDTIHIHALTDIHVGAVEHDFKKFNEAIKSIKKDDNARWFANGDILELIPPNYKINQRGQSIPPEDQYMEFVERVEPIRDKCLFIRGGNHDYLRSFNILDFDVCKVMAKELSVPYYRLPGYSKISVKGKDWYLVSGHGKSGAKNGDLELDKMAAVYPWGDVFFLGHNHQLYAKPVDSIVVDDCDEETLRRRWYIRGGSFLRYADYARYSFYQLVRTGWVTIEFSDSRIRCWEN